MGDCSYIAAIEIGSSKISGAIGVETYDGIKIVAYASEPVNGFIAKGVVRNVDETGHCLTSIINRMEAQMENIEIQKAYIAFGGQSMKSVKSTVVKDFNEYTKITPDIIENIASENDTTFIVPDGYQKIQVIPQEYRLNGDINTSPIGIPTRRIESNFLNIIIKEQYIKQLEESLKLSNIEVADSFNAARIEADILLSEDEKRSGCALVNIGSETTTIVLYSNNIMRQIIVLPLGSENITKDLCSENITHQEAEQLKIFKGYASDAADNSALPTELVDEIIGARVAEILLNVKHRIELSKEGINSIIVTGGGAKLKNINMLLEEHLCGFKLRIVTDFASNYRSEESLYLMKGALTPTLYGLLKMGKENCCRKEEIVATQPTPQDLFTTEETIVEEPAVQKESTVKAPKENSDKKGSKAGQRIKEIFFDFFENATREEDDDNE